MRHFLHSLYSYVFSPHRLSPNPNPSSPSSRRLFPSPGRGQGWAVPGWAVSLWALLFILLLAACGGGGGDEPEPTPTPTPTPTPGTTGKHLQQTCDLPAAATEQVVTLNGLTSGVSRQVGTVGWLSTELLPYTSGTPQVLLKASENLEMQARQHQVQFIAQRDTVTLTVRQAAYSANGGTDTGHPLDTPTDQPAYSPRR